MNLNRRGFLGGLISAIAAPAIVRIDNIMHVSVPKLILPNRNNLLTIDMITREAIELFRNSNAFIQQDLQDFDAAVGSALRIRLPKDYL